MDFVGSINDLCGYLIFSHSFTQSPPRSKERKEASESQATAAAVFGCGTIPSACIRSPTCLIKLALVIALMGFAGGLVMSAIKRDRGVKDYGSLIEGHGGVLDRVDSLVFAAPLFFHLTRFFF